MIARSRIAAALPVLGTALAVAACTTALPSGDGAAPSGARQVRVAPDLPLPQRPDRAGGDAGGPAGSLDRAIAGVAGPAVLLLAPGHYVLEREAYTDPTCGNCEDAAESVTGTLGLRISGSGIVLRGSHRDSVIIHTRAGYGLLFEDCDGCALSGVTVTGGTRDPDGRATNAGVVVRRSRLTVEDCVIRDNIGDSTTVAGTVVGIAGIAGREASDLTVRGCTIQRNSWDGIALYRGARATITGNVVDGVDKAAGGRIGGGRGVGIGLTWDARAVIEGNRVTRYWKGIGAFVQAEADIRENIVEDILTWGISLWGPSSATPIARIERNVVYRTGACGIMIDRPDGGGAPGHMADNVVIRTGQSERYDSGEPYCWQRPVARHHVPAGFAERGTLLFDNRQPRDAGSAPPPAPELRRDVLVQRARPITAGLAARAALAGALLFREWPELGR
jgi:parallel beta-helix repeat protein